MSEDSKKNQQKGKNEPKDQRRRRGRHQHAANIEKSEKKPAGTKVPALVKPAYEPPPPEFYANLKRETDEILKITEEANTKYKKKEIQSNWAKYEMPIESYEEIDEQENLGADYEALIQTPLSVGGHFQFKHEKSWDITTGPSPYDKYFDINKDTLSAALSTIPFFERNNIDTAFFNESDIKTMNHRATKYKQKYYNDLKTDDKILKSELLSNSTEIADTNEMIKPLHEKCDKTQSQFKDIKLEDCEKESIQITCNEDGKIKNNVSAEPSNVIAEELASKNLLKPVEVTNQSYDSNIVKESETCKHHEVSKTTADFKNNKTVDNDFDEFIQNDVISSKNQDEVEKEINGKLEVQAKPVDVVPREKEPSKAPSPQDILAKNPIIESPEDLEKWLDDFLDG